jgi:hypothetical protein
MSNFTENDKRFTLWRFSVELSALCGEAFKDLNHREHRVTQREAQRFASESCRNFMLQEETAN